MNLLSVPFAMEPQLGIKEVSRGMIARTRHLSAWFSHYCPARFRSRFPSQEPGSVSFDSVVTMTGIEIGLIVDVGRTGQAGETHDGTLQRQGPRDTRLALPAEGSLTRETQRASHHRRRSGRARREEQVWARCFGHAAHIAHDVAATMNSAGMKGAVADMKDRQGAIWGPR